MCSILLHINLPFKQNFILYRVAVELARGRRSEGARRGGGGGYGRGGSYGGGRRPGWLDK